MSSEFLAGFEAGLEYSKCLKDHEELKALLARAKAKAAVDHWARRRVMVAEGRRAVERRAPISLSHWGLYEV